MNKGTYRIGSSSHARNPKGDVLVEADEEGKMLVKAINGVFDADADMLDAPATGDEDFDGARYMYTPALGGIMYTHKMSPMPKCVLDLNIAKINGWSIDPVGLVCIISVAQNH